MTQREQIHDDKPLRVQIPHVRIPPKKPKLLEESTEPIETPVQPTVPKVVGDIIGKQPINWGKTTAKLTKVSCAFTAQELLMGPSEPPYNGKFFIGDHHLAWDELIAKYNRLCILAPRDHGKCVRGNHTIITGNGSRVKAQDWQGGELLAYDVERARYVAVHCPPVVENGVKPIFEITTATGRVLGVTEEHPLLQYHGWVHAKDIKVGDRVAVVNGIGDLGKRKLESPWLLGLLIGDGSFRAKSTVSITTTYASILENLITECEIRGWRLTGEGVHYRIPVKGVPHDKRCDAWLKGLGLWGKRSSEKFVPEQVFEARDSDIAEFLAGYFDADGGIERDVIKASSTSHQLLKDVQSLLARLGIISVVRKKKKSQYKGELYAFFELAINNGSTVQFHRCIPLRSHKALALIDLLRRNEQKDVSRGKSLKGPVFWDEVVKVEVKPSEMTYAIQVPEYHTYISEDVINHNTFFFDFAYPIWKAINNPGKVGFIFSATQPMAERILGDIKEELENNPKLNWLVPTKKEHWRVSSIKCSNGHKIYARGLGTKIRGAHPIWIVVDDALSDDTAYSELTRRKQIDYFYTAITNMITPGGQIIVVGTPFAKEDLYGKLKKNREYKFVKYQALDERGKALWTERYSKKALVQRKREIGSIRFSREFLCCKGNTYVETIAGHVPIESVKVGTLVLTHKNRWKKVTRVFESDYFGNLIRIKDVLEVTPNHNVLTQDGWIEAGYLTPTDFIMYPTEHGEDWIEVVDIQITFHEGKVYNLEVEGDNSYIADGIAVHNCNPIDDSSSFFPKRLFQGDPVEQYGLTLGMSKEFWEDKGVQIYMGVDFAMSTSIQADYLVVWVMGKDSFGNRWLIDIHRHKGMPFQEQLSLINELGRKYDPALIYLESNQMQRIFGDELIRTSDLPITKFTTGIQKHSLENGLPSLRILLENGKFRIPRGDAKSVEVTNLWIEEMANFTFENGKLSSVGAHDDMPMACWICNEAIKKGGFAFSFGDAEGEQMSSEEILAELTEARSELLGGKLKPEPAKGNGNGKAKPGNGSQTVKTPTNGNGKAAINSNTSVNLVDDNDLLHSLPKVLQWY